ncbi:DoxX family protein [Natrinema gelatinilyticum]|uniref:DoxX family protein n=1 Tax=Natrinema gelatinilyticum TaxID=2961571 RepID=UPI0020C3F499|nr:DoxX family protein [Natrinema gelatinilyticum]
MSTNDATIQWFGRRETFEYADSIAGYVLVAVRLLVGYWFLHSGWGKFAFVAGDPFSAAGYLQNAQSPIAWLFEIVAGTPWLLEVTNVMIPLGEFLIGLGLVLGAFVRLAAFFGGVLMTLFYLGNADWAHGYVNGDLLGFLMFVIVGAFAAGRILGVDAFLEATEFVRQRPWLRYLLG